MNQTLIRLMVVDDHPAFRFGIIGILANYPDITVVAECTNGVEAVESYRKVLPDVVSMDLRMPELGGVEAILEIRREFPDCRIIVLTTYDSDEDVFRAVKSGAKSYLLKNASQDQIVATIRAVYLGHDVFPQPLVSMLSQRLNRKDLTEREMEVLKLIVDGRNNKEIASDIAISERTVKFHLSSLFTKLKVLDRTQAAIAAIRHGIIHIK